MVERITIIRLVPVVVWWLVVDLLRGEYGWPIHVALAAFFGGGFFLAKATEIAYRRTVDADEPVTNPTPNEGDGEGGQ